MNKTFYIVGENVDGEFIETWYKGTKEECIIWAEQELYIYGGGHLDIFIIHDDCDEFVGDVEV